MPKNSIVFTILLLVAMHFSAFAQVHAVVDNIAFEGMKKTKESYLLQRVGFEAGQTYSDSLQNVFRQRLLNLYSVLNVDSEFDNGILSYKIEEKRTLLPIINFGGIKGNVWFQLGFNDINFLGRGHQVLSYYQNTDSRHTAELYYKIPYLGKSQWGATWNLRKWASVEPLFFDEGAVRFNYDNEAFGIGIIRHFGIFEEIELGFTGFRETYSKLQIQELENPPGPEYLEQNKWLIKCGILSNHIDYHDFRLQRHRWTALMQLVYTREDKSYFNSFITEWRQFYRTGLRGNLAIKLRAAISTNNDSPFAPFVVDSHVNLRGVGNRIDRGTAQLIINFEYRHTIANSSSWASQLIVFTDAGSWRNPGGTLKQLFDSQQFRQFVGGGFRIIYKRMHDAILRVDYGVDVYNPEEKGIVVGIGQYF